MRTWAGEDHRLSLAGSTISLQCREAQPPLNPPVRRLSFLRAVDSLIIAFTMLLTFIVLALAGVKEGSTPIIVTNVAACCLMVGLAVAASKTNNALVRAIHDWYPVPVIFLVFKEIHAITELLGSHDWDALFIGIDRAIFQTDPTVWFGGFSAPLITELLQIAYASYYFIMLAVGIELFMRKERQKFSFILFAITFGFFLSYLGYLAFPAIGPRFTLHDFNSLSTELPGIWFTNVIRHVLNAGESIPESGVNAYLLAQRDAFPSGHTEMTLISMYLAARYRLHSRYVLYAFGTLLIISTVYLRYHYVIDLVAGLAFMLFVVWTAPIIFTWFEGIKKEESSI